MCLERLCSPCVDCPQLSSSRRPQRRSTPLPRRSPRPTRHNRPREQRGGSRPLVAAQAPALELALWQSQNGYPSATLPVRAHRPHRLPQRSSPSRLQLTKSILVWKTYVVLLLTSIAFYSPRYSLGILGTRVFFLSSRLYSESFVAQLPRLYTLNLQRLSFLPLL